MNIKNNIIDYSQIKSGDKVWIELHMMDVVYDGKPCVIYSSTTHMKNSVIYCGPANVYFDNIKNIVKTKMENSLLPDMRNLGREKLIAHHIETTPGNVLFIWEIGKMHVHIFSNTPVFFILPIKIETSYSGYNQAQPYLEDLFISTIDCIKEKI